MEPDKLNDILVNLRDNEPDQRTVINRDDDEWILCDKLREDEYVKVTEGVAGNKDLFVLTAKGELISLRAGKY